MPYGVVTQFSSPVEKDYTIPPTNKERRRSLSYKNSASACEKPFSIEEWTNMLKTGETNIELDFDKVALPKKKRVIEQLVAPIHNEPEKELQSNSSSQDLVAKHEFEMREPHKNNKLNSALKKKRNMNKRVSIIDTPVILIENDLSVLTIYKALFIGTDSDFLEQSRMRALFRANAVSKEESKLFEIPAFTGTEINDIEILLEQPAICCGSTRYGKIFRKYKCQGIAILLVLLILGIIGGVVYVAFKPYGRNSANDGLDSANIEINGTII